MQRGRRVVAAVAVIATVMLSGCGAEHSFDALVTPLPAPTQSETPSATPVPQETQSQGTTDASPEPSDPSATDPCEGLNVPTDVQPFVCADDWASAIDLQPTSGSSPYSGAIKTVMPSGNTGCDDGPACWTYESDWVIPKPHEEGPSCRGYAFDANGEVIPNCQGGVMEWMLAVEDPVQYGDVTELTYDNTYRFPSGNLCHSDYDFLVCWNAETRHGFQVSRVVNNTW